MIYLASPYSHSDPAIREMRYRQAEEAMVQMLRSGEAVYSPIAMTHAAVARYNLSLESGYWRPHNYAILARCDELRVLKIPGWDSSIGVGEEIEYAIDSGKAISYWVEENMIWVPAITRSER